MERNNAPVKFTDVELELIYEQALFQVHVHIKGVELK